MIEGHRVQVGSGRMSLEGLKYIPASKVPSITKYRQTEIDKILESIPIGQALVIEGEKKVIALISALRRRKEKGLYPNLIGTTRKQGKIGYIINKKEEKQD